MHQIYSCSDENLEVFTTVISSKSCSPARRRAKTTQHILTKSVRKTSLSLPLFIFFFFIPKKGRRAPSRAGAAVASKPTAPHSPCSSQACQSQAQARHIPLQPGSPWFSVASHHKRGRRATEANALLISALFASHRQRWRKTAEYDLALPQGAEASLPLTGGNLCGTPSLLRKMWMKHKKKSEYLGATNSAFEAD
uniref:Vexin n=4 Tax=Accipitrinae TaxID=8955 RepID=A0A663E8E3_AQUCH